jgi:hypothetical protein
MSKRNAAQVTEEIKELIALTAEETAKRIFANSENITKNYFAIVEKLLRNYKRLEMLLKNENEYLNIELHNKSKSITTFSPSSGNQYKTEADTAEEAARNKAVNYERTAANFREVEQVIDMFKEEKWFILIRMYYFNETPEGRERDSAAPPYTWEEIAAELSDLGIILSEKTARRWRNKLITDIAICMFGKPAAVSASQYRPKKA